MIFFFRFPQFIYVIPAYLPPGGRARFTVSSPLFATPTSQTQGEFPVSLISSPHLPLAPLVLCRSLFVSTTFTAPQVFWLFYFSALFPRFPVLRLNGFARHFAMFPALYNGCSVLPPCHAHDHSTTSDTTLIQGRFCGVATSPCCASYTFTLDDILNAHGHSRCSFGPLNRYDAPLTVSLQYLPRSTQSCLLVPISMHFACLGPVRLPPPC